MCIHTHNMHNFLKWDHIDTSLLFQSTVNHGERIFIPLCLTHPLTQVAHSSFHLYNSNSRGGSYLHFCSSLKRTVREMPGDPLVPRLLERCVWTPHTRTLQHTTHTRHTYTHCHRHHAHTTHTTRTHSHHTHTPSSRWQVSMWMGEQQCSSPGGEEEASRAAVSSRDTWLATRAAQAADKYRHPEHKNATKSPV